MTVKTEITCNLCHQPVSQKGDSSSGYHTAVGLKWETIRGMGDRLTINHKWNECPIHLCVKCLDNIFDVTTDMRNSNMIPKPKQ